MTDEIGGGKTAVRSSISKQLDRRIREWEKRTGQPSHTVAIAFLLAAGLETLEKRGENYEEGQAS